MHTAWLGYFNNCTGTGVARRIGLNSNHVFSWHLQPGFQTVEAVEY